MKLDNIKRDQNFAVAIAPFFVGVFVSVLMFWILAQGPGVSPDSITYIEAAKNLSSGNGFFVNGQPITHYPPVFPLILGLFGLLTGGDFLIAGRLLAALMFGANIAVICFAVQACTKNSIVAIGCSILVFLVSKQAIEVHAYILSEGLYIFFSMTGLFLLAQYISQRKLLFLVLASLLLGLAVLTRYAGIVLFSVIIFTILFLDNRSAKYKLSATLMSVGIASVPNVLWMVRNLLIAETMTNRNTAVHPLTINHVKTMINTLHDFVLPLPISDLTQAVNVAVALTLLVFACGVLSRHKDLQNDVIAVSYSYPIILIIYCLFYVGALVISISFFDAHTVLDQRVLLPVSLALAVAVIIVAWSLSEILVSRYIWYGFVLFLFLSISLNAPHALSTSISIHKNGLIYTATQWKESAVLSYIGESVPKGMKLYSNNPDVILLYQNRYALMLPGFANPTTRQQNKNFSNQMGRVIKEINEGTALIVCFNRVARSRWYLPKNKELESWNVPSLIKLKDGTIYGI